MKGAVSSLLNQLLNRKPEPDKGEQEDQIDSILFATTWGREFSDAVPPELESCGVDAESVFHEAFDVEPTLEFLMQMGPAQLEQLRDAANSYFECSSVTVDQMKAAVENTIWHWTA